MSYPEYDEIIARAELEMRALSERMDRVVADYIRATRDWAATTCKEWVERAVKTNPARTIQYGIEGLREMKADLAAIIAAIPADVGTIGDDRYWPHRSEPDLTNELKYVGQLPAEEAARELLGAVGSLLVKHGFATTSEHGWKPSESNTVRWAGWYEQSAGMKAALDRYVDLLGDYAVRAEERAEALSERLNKQASDLWDSA